MPVAFELGVCFFVVVENWFMLEDERIARVEDW